MIDFALKLFFLTTLANIHDVHTECDEEVSEEYEGRDPASLNSESFENFNISSKENVINSEDISEMENETMAIHSDKEVVSGEESKRKGSIVNPSLKPAEVHKENRIAKISNKTISKQLEVNYPFSVSIQRKWSHYTSGALVDKQWVLTSAGEFYNGYLLDAEDSEAGDNSVSKRLDKSSRSSYFKVDEDTKILNISSVRESIKIFRARLGSVNCKKGGVLVPIKQVEVHPSYVPNKPGFDIALLKLGVPVEYDQFVAPIAISQTRGRVVSAKFLATYWPRLIVKGRALPATAKERVKQYSMRVSTQKLIPWDECHQLMEHNNVTLEPSSHCLEPILSHHSPCMPDPGAPVLAKDGLWGTTSGWTSKRCPMSGSATVFTRLSSPRVHSWLQLLLVDLL